jgi:hypothetical protein
MKFIFFAIVFAAVSSFGQGVEVYSRLSSGSLFSNEIGLHLRVFNNSGMKLNLSKASLSYRFIDASSLDKFAYDVWWFSKGNTTDAKISFHEIDSNEKFFNLYFTDGEVESGSYAEIQLRIHKTDWSPFSMFGDYSLPLSGTEWAANPNIAFSNAASEYPLLPPGGQGSGSAQSGFHLPDLLLDLGDYSVFGSNEVRFADRVSENSGRVEIHGSVGSGNYAEIGADGKVVGNLYSRGVAFLRERAQLLGNLRVGENYTMQNSVLIGGEKLIGMPIPDFNLPVKKDLKAGSADLFIGGNETRHLEPGAYRDLTAYANSVLHLKAGKYTFRNFRLEPEAKLKLDLSSGIVEINATETVTFSDRVSVSYQDGYANPLAFKVYQHGSQDLRLGTDLGIGGYFAAPNAAIRVSSRVNFAGWLHGKNIYVEPDTKICEPPTLAGLSHSKIAYAPHFSALTSEYRTAHGANDLEAFAKAKDKNTVVEIYRDGSKFKIKLYAPEKASINPQCARTEYSLAIGSGENPVVYVKESSECSGNSCDGSGWGKAFRSLRKGLAAAKMQGKSVWLAEGSYNVSADSLLRIGMGTEMRGGFKGESGETPETRHGDINKTVISGNGGNTFLFLGGSDLPHAAYLDMATLTGGNILSVGAAPILDYLVIRGNSVEAEGGGIHSVLSDGLKVSNSYIVNNKALSGGALHIDGGSMALENSIVSANKAVNGAAIYAVNAKLKIRHSTIVGNFAQAGKGIVLTSNANAESVNNIIWNNGGSDMAATVQDPLFKSIIAAGEDGLFFTKDDGYALADNSPMIDKGVKIADIPIDIFQMDRAISKDGSGLPDMGAREWFFDVKKGIVFLKRMADKSWGISNENTILSESVGQYFPLKRRNAPYMYNLSVKSPKNKHMKDKHSAKVAILDENGNVCGEKKKFTFYRIAEENGIVEYRTYRDGDGQFLFLAEKEMPSDDWYHVLKVCEGSKFRIEVEVTE